jgi:GT2 family glycosyltransferase
MNLNFESTAESTFGVGLVAYNMCHSDIIDLTKSIISEKPIYMVVMDNSPNTNSKYFFESNGWTYLSNKLNPGFGKSHNVIFNKFGKLSDYHLVINPDISFKKGVIQNIMNFMNLKSDAGAVMPKIVYDNNENQGLVKLLPSPMNLLINKLSLKFLNVFNKKFLLSSINYDEGIFRVPFLSGCFLFLRSSVILEIGLFDERYFMYAEDLDLTRRLWINKTYPYYYSNDTVKHGYKKESSKSLKLLFIHIFSVIKYFNKWGWIDKKRNEINNECLLQFKNN